MIPDHPLRDKTFSKKNEISFMGSQREQTSQMRIPLELEHLVKSAHVDNSSKPTSLAGYLSVIDSRKALEVEHYLRACALRLDLTELPIPTAAINKN